MFSATPSAPRSGFLAVLLNQPFMMLFCGQVVSQIADKVYFVLLLSLPYSYQSPPTWASSMPAALVIAFTLSAILFGFVAGIVVDHFPKKYIMIAVDAICGVLILLIPLLQKQLFILWAITFFISSIKQFLYPAEQAAIPLLVQRENLMSANALFMTATMVSLIVGFAIGQPLLSLVTNWAGESSQGLFVAGLYLLAALTRVFIHIQEMRNNMSLLSIHPWRDFQEGLSYLWNNRKVTNAIVQKTILYLAFAAISVRAFDLAQRMGLKSTQFGFPLAAAGLGIVFGAGILGQWGNRFQHKPLSALGFLTIAFVLAMITLTRNVWLGLGLFVVLGLGFSLIDLPVQTVIQAFTQQSMRGRAFAFQNSVVYIASSVMLVIAGVLSDTLGLEPMFFGISILIAIVGVWAWQNRSSVSQDI